MKIYLVRHGDSDFAPNDNERQLSDKGVADIKQLANFIAPLKLQVSYVFQSPRRRTHQTAQILSSSISVTHGIETKAALEPSAPINDILDEVLSLNQNVLLTGHMPFLGKLAAQLTTGNENKDIVSFNAGSMLCLERIDDKRFIICWMLSPDLFR